MTDPSPSPAVVFRHPSDGTVWPATGTNIDRLREWGWVEDDAEERHDIDEPDIDDTVED